MNPGNDAMIRTIGLTKRYGTGHSEKTAVRDLNLVVPKGEFWIVSGPSGCGKTTLLGMLAGMIAPTRGEVFLAGKPITHLRDHHRALVRRNLVGMVFQEFALVSGMDLLDNLLLPLVPTGGASGVQRQRAIAWLHRFGMADFVSSKIEQLSAGERQRAAIIRALLVDAPILLLDEPTAALDADNVRVIIDTLTGLRDEGRTILATSHDPRLAEHPGMNGVLRLVDGVLQE